jgi:hypothetical protein
MDAGKVELADDSCRGGVAPLLPECALHLHGPDPSRPEIAWPLLARSRVDPALRPDWTGSRFLSLFLMQTVVARRWGWPAGWCFAVAVSALAGFGIFLGRFRRWNSWDVLLNPFSFIGDMVVWLATLLHRPTSGIMPVLFALFVLLAYLMFYALTNLPTGTASPLRESNNNQP